MLWERRCTKHEWTDFGMKTCIVNRATSCFKQPVIILAEWQEEYRAVLFQSLPSRSTQNRIAQLRHLLHVACSAKRPDELRTQAWTAFLRALHSSLPLLAGSYHPCWNNSMPGPNESKQARGGGEEGPQGMMEEVWQGLQLLLLAQLANSLSSWTSEVEGAEKEAATPMMGCLC